MLMPFFFLDESRSDVPSATIYNATRSNYCASSYFQLQHRLQLFKMSVIQ